MDKLCVFCSHFRVDMGEPNWSELTPGADAELCCDENLWEMVSGDREIVFRQHITKAETCDLYDPPSTTAREVEMAELLTLMLDTDTMTNPREALTLRDKARALLAKVNGESDG